MRSVEYWRPAGGCSDRLCPRHYYYNIDAIYTAPLRNSSATFVRLLVCPASCRLGLKFILLLLHRYTGILKLNIIFLYYYYYYICPKEYYIYIYIHNIRPLLTYLTSLTYSYYLVNKKYVSVILL